MCTLIFVAISSTVIACFHYCYYYHEAWKQHGAVGVLGADCHHVIGWDRPPHSSTGCCPDQAGFQRVGGVWSFIWHSLSKSEGACFGRKRLDTDAKLNSNVQTLTLHKARAGE